MNVVFLQGGAGGSGRRRREMRRGPAQYGGMPKSPPDRVADAAPQRFTIEYIPTCKYNIKQQHGKLQRTRARQHP